MKNWVLDFLHDITAKAKRAHRSGTLWFNAFFETVNEVLPYLLPYLVVHFPELEAYMPSEAFTWSMRVILIVNMMYRFKTTKALKDK